MRITRTVHQQAPIPHQTVHIEIHPEDDPYGVLNGLIFRGRLAAFLQVLSRRDDASPATQHEMMELLARFAFVANLCEVRLNELMVEARDEYVLSWRSIATQTEIPPTTVVRRVEKMRTQAAHEEAEG